MAGRALDAGLQDLARITARRSRYVCREFIVLCRRLHLLAETIIAIDDGKFKAVNNRDKNLTDAKLKKRMERLAEALAAIWPDSNRARPPNAGGRVLKLLASNSIVDGY